MFIEPARAAEVVAHIVAASSAWQRTRAGRADFTPTLRPLWLFLALTLAVDAFRALGQHATLRDAPRPFTGLARAVFHVDQAGVIGWSAGLVAVVLVAFAERDRRVLLLPIACFAAGITIAFAFAYPELREQKLGLAYLVVHIATVLVCLGCAALAWFRDRWFGPAARASTVLIVGEIATLFGPYLGEPLKHWATANAISAVTYLVLAWELRRPRTVVT